MVAAIYERNFLPVNNILFLTGILLKMFCNEVIKNNLQHQKKKYNQVEKVPIGIFLFQRVLFFILF
jgi:hypothetical protein